MRRCVRGRWRHAACAAALVAATALASGCGGDDGASGSTSARSPPRTQATTPTTTTEHVVVRTPQQALIRRRDLPTKWVAAVPLPQGLGCGSNEPFRRATASARTPRLRQLSAKVDVEETLGLFHSEQEANRVYRQLISAKAERCFRMTMRQRLRSFSASGSAVVTPVDPGRIDELGPHSRSARYTTTISGELGIGRTYIVAITTQTGRGVAATLVISGFSSLRERTYARIASITSERLGQLVS